MTPAHRGVEDPCEASRRHHAYQPTKSRRNPDCGHFDLSRSDHRGVVSEPKPPRFERRSMRLHSPAGDSRSRSRTTTSRFSPCLCRRRQHQRIRNARPSSGFGRRACHRARRFHAPHARRQRGAEFLDWSAGESACPRQSRQAPVDSLGRRGRLGRQTRPHYRQGSNRSCRRGASAPRRVLRRARPMDARRRAILRGAVDGPPQRAREGRR